MKKTSKILLTVIVVVLLGIGVSTFFKVNGSIGNDKIQLRLAHGQAGDSEIGGTIAYLSDLVAEDESMNMEVSIYPSGVLGSETAMVELVQAGVLDMAKISANTLGQFDDRYTIFSLPYLFKGQEHYYNAMANSQVIRELFNRNRILLQWCAQLLSERRCGSYFSRRAERQKDSFHGQLHFHGYD